MVRTRSHDNASDCPICMERARLAVETNCGHLYCGTCILRAWNTNMSSSPLACPYCRQDVTLMLPCYSEHEVQDDNPLFVQERTRLDADIAEYNRLYSSHPRSLWGQFLDLPTILRHVMADMFTWRGLAFFYRVRIVFCFIIGLVYTLMPFDLIPEALLGFFGLIDDFIIVVFLLIQIGIFYRNNFANA